MANSQAEGRDLHRGGTASIVVSLEVINLIQRIDAGACQTAVVADTAPAVTGAVAIIRAVRLDLHGVGARRAAARLEGGAGDLLYFRLGHVKRSDEC